MLVSAVVLHIIGRGIFGSHAALAAVLAVFMICAMLSVFVAPAVAGIKKPALYTKLENFWWGLFETETSGGEPGLSTSDVAHISGEGGIPDYMITNDPFPSDDDTPICGIRTTYPLSRLYRFSCGDYDPESDSFSIWDDLSPEPGTRSPAENYFKQALESSAEMPQKAVIIDFLKSQSMVLVPYCSFTVKTDGVLSFGDRFLYRYEEPSTVQYSFDPDASYKYASGGYSTHAQSEFLGLPEEFREDLDYFLLTRGITKADPDIKNKIAKVREMLSAEYVFSYTPPELPYGEDPVMWFLQVSKTGYSKHFAAAEVFLYRALGIPARYSFGYNVREYDDGAAIVLRYDAVAFCEVFADGAWRLPEDVLSGEGYSEIRLGPETTTEVKETEGPVQLANGYDISHLKGTPSMFGAYDDSQSFSVSRTAVDQDDNTVILVFDTAVKVDYVKAFSTGEYVYKEGSFTILSDTRFAPEFEENKSFGDYSKGAFMSPEPMGEQQDTSQSFRVFNLFAPRYIYAPVYDISTKGLAAGSPESFSMSADRMIVPLSGSAAYNDYTLFAGGEAAGANEAYTSYALSKYTSVPEEMLYYLKEFLRENHIDPDDPDKEALIRAVRSLLGSYNYTTQIEAIPEGEDPVMWFLTQDKSGYCIHFASAGTMLLRACGIPARFVSGYLKEMPAGTVAEITAKDAHAWTEVFNGSTWQLVEMCVGRPAEGQSLPSGLRTADEPYSLPIVETPGRQDGQTPILTIAEIAAAAVVILAAAIVILLGKNRPSIQQKAEIQYRYIKKYYYISDDTQRLLNKISYSREGAQPEDIKAIADSVAKARSLLLYRRKYLNFAASMVAYAFWHIKAAVQNLFSSSGSKVSR